MDYLPIFHPSRELRIPCVKSNGYQYQGYYQYLANHPLQSCGTTHEREIWIQELLFFSVIHDFSRCAEVAILPIHLVKVDEGQEYLTTRSLQDAVIEKIRSKATLNRFRRRVFTAACLEFKGVLIAASDTLFELHRDLHTNDHNEIRSSVLLSIATCLESLNHAFALLFSSDPANLSLPRMEKYIEESMTQAGWCSSKIRDFLPFSPCAGYLATQLQPSYQHQHEDHRSCSVRQCLPSTNRARYFQPKHVDGCTSNCLALSVDTNALEMIIADGYIPIVYVEEVDSQMILRVRKRRRSSRAKGYVAISHVWSHGLGNEDGNSLPLCQVKRISNLIRKTFPARGLWMDTLCIPRYRKSVAQGESPMRQAEMKKHRLMAIERMAEIYELADAVIVLDEHLDNVGSNRYHRQLSLTCSDWMSRLWTLQEAIKGFQCLYIKFGDDLIAIQDLLSFEQQRPLSRNFCLSSNGLDEEINSSVPYEFSALLFGRDVFDEGEKSLPQLVQSLRRRATTVPRDEFICLITILGLRSDLIHQELSMANFLRNLEAIPEDLVFYSGERLTERGFRWAPKTFLTQPPTMFSLYEDTRGISLLSDDGNMQGLLICKDVIWIHEPFYFNSHRSVDSKEYQAYVAIDLDNERPATLFRADRSIDLGSRQLEARRIPPSSLESSSPLMGVWRESRDHYPAALVIHQGHMDEDTAANGNIEHAVLISNIRAYSSEQGGECIYGGDYELLVRCFGLSQVPHELRTTAVQLRTSFQSRVPIALS